MERDRLTGGLFVWAESINCAMTAARKSSILRTVEARRLPMIRLRLKLVLPESAAPEPEVVSPLITIHRRKGICQPHH